MDTKQINEYWNSAEKLLTLASKYEQKVSLKENLSDESTAWRVRGVFERYYGGSAQKLNKGIKNAKEEFEWQVMVFNINCRENGVLEVKRVEALLRLLCDMKRRDFYKKTIKQAKTDKIILSLQDVEANYKKSSK